jgi:hypothetical protein
MFLTAFHTTSNNDLSKYSTGEYIAKDSGVGQTLATFARHSQSQARYAKLYERVNTWALEAGGTTLGWEAADVDLDGVNEYLLFNSRLFGVFERKGGRMTAAWMRNPTNGKVWQVAGNFAAYSNTDTEDEGSDNATAYRTSGFKDWWIEPTETPPPNGGEASVNVDYAVTASGVAALTFSNQPDLTKIAQISKVVSLASTDAKTFTATYTLGGANKAYIRFGLSPNLEDLLVRGQAGLGNEVLSSNNRRVALTNTSDSSEIVRAFVEVSSAGTINPGASDLVTAGTTLLRRNQAQTHQVEVILTGEGPHIISLGFDDGTDTPNPDSDADGLLDSWEISNFENLNQTANGDPDGDGVVNLLEMKLRSNPNSSASTGLPTPSVSSLTSTGFTITFDTVSGLNYQVVGTENLAETSWPDIGPSIQGDDDTHTVSDSSSINSSSKFYKVQITAP